MSLKKNELMDMWSYLSRDLSESVKSKILKVTGRGNTSASRDYISANCLLSEVLKVNPEFDFSKVQSDKDLWDTLHPSTRFRLRCYTPCLAARYDELKSDQQNSLWDSSDWVATEKMNGCRGWLIYHNGDIHLYSRNYSDKDCSLLEYWNNINQDVDTSKNIIYAVDVEIKFEPNSDIRKDLAYLGLETDSTLEAMVALLHTYPEEARKIQEKFKERYHKDLIVFRLIAPLYFEGKNYLKRPLGDGMDIYQDCIAQGQALGFNIKPIQRCSGSRVEKEIFLNSILDAGGEGIVFHNRKGSYCTSENRSKTSFIKLKRSVKSTIEGQGLGDSFDGFVGGFIPGSKGTANEGIIGSFNFYIYINNNGVLRKHWIASVPNITREERILATWNNADGLYPVEWEDSKGEKHWMSLNPDFDGLVGELTGQAISSKSIRIEHPSLVIWRTERMPESCIYTQAFIDSQTTNHENGIKYR